MFSLRRNTPNNKRSEKNRSEEGCETQGQENVAFNKAYEYDDKPQRRESELEVKGKNFLPWTAGQKQPIPVGEKWKASYPPRQNHQRNHHGNQEQNVGGFPNKYFADVHCCVGFRSR